MPVSFQYHFSYLTSIDVLPFNPILTLPKVSIKFTGLTAQFCKTALISEGSCKPQFPRLPTLCPVLLQIGGFSQLLRFDNSVGQPTELRKNTLLMFTSLL